jgi:hypothetical protein
MSKPNLKEKFLLIYQAFQNKQDSAAHLLSEFIQENNCQTNRVKRGENFRALVNFGLPNIFVLALRNNDVKSCQMLVDNGFAVTFNRQLTQELHSGELNYQTRFFLISEIYKSKSLTGDLFLGDTKKYEFDKYALWDFKNCMLEALEKRDEEFVVKMIKLGYNLEKFSAETIECNEDGDREARLDNLSQKLDKETLEFYEKCEMQSLIDDDELNIAKSFSVERTLAGANKATLHSLAAPNSNSSSDFDNLNYSQTLATTDSHPNPEQKRTLRRAGPSIHINPLVAKSSSLDLLE